MQPLDKTLRNQLDRTVRKARPVAEQAAEAALEQLGVGEPKVPEYLGESQRKLRQRLRAHARSLGDPLKEGAQAVTRLISEIAYEHWHRMLFARFLAENELLMYDGVAVTLEECEELAEEEAEQGERTSGWALAARLASTMLPQVFRVDSPVFELTLAAEHQRELEELLAGLPLEVFHASDSLGWVYQFWQTDNKERINRSEVKIGADELPAVTQLFTEPYMVSFLLDNSLGAWWAARRLSETDLASAESEQELRDKASLPGVPLEYLRFVKDEETGNWTPAAGTFDAWPQSLAELKTLDPCCGSGHFLVAALLMLVPMRMELEGLSARDAVDAVLRDNLHGLEIDQRCVELAAFALALTAWRYPGTGGYRKLPVLHLACSGLPISVAKEEWKALGLGKKNLTIALDWLYDSFKDAPILGSLLDPTRTSAAKIAQWEELSEALNQALSQEATQESSDEQHETAVTAQGLAKAATLLGDRYHWVITNVPYLARGKQHPKLQSFCADYYPAAKNDLATVFLDRCLELCVEGGTTSNVLPQNWLFLTSYKKFREKLLQNDIWHLIARLGPGAFETISGEVVKAILINLSRGSADGQVADLLHPNSQATWIRGVDVSEPRTEVEKASGLLTDEVKSVEQAKQLENPDAIIQIENSSEHELFYKVATCFQGTSTGDNQRLVRSFWECEVENSDWEFLEGVPEHTKHAGGKDSAIKWKDVVGFESSAVRGWEAFEKKGIAIGQMNSLPATIYFGRRFPNTTPVIIPLDSEDLPSIWSFCGSVEFSKSLRQVNQKLSVDNGYVGKIPFDTEYWAGVAKEQYPNGLPAPYTNDPTQWIFHGHPCGSVIWDEEAKWTAHGPRRTDDTVLQVAVARLLGYRWPAELDPEMELAEEQREWVKRCEALLDHADRDGIVCLPAVRGERRAVDRLEALLADAYGDQWSATTRGKLLESVDHAGKDLESWLRDKFFAQHCKLFQNRPFIWHIWDGLKDGFSALVNYHQLDYKALETLTYTYLGDWITQQKRQIGEGVDGAEGRLAAAEALQKSLELILEGEEPYDIFVRWKPLEEQPIGWHPDLNDGVRLNIRPFLSVPDVKKKGAGVLVHKPNIHWKKDRGKDVETAPWYHLGPQLGGAKGDRINDYHLTLMAKRAAREIEEAKNG
ncbi:Eco57I restriction-modification methylase domain-containing protein [Franzmannia qiaohouensis]|uniref:site-specific DNA-methyltransferase (adenine-specific) n=1 Tax=Franzmannia qiaohouensis TaxID=1329370 RepID=A0ABU1HJR2_9GAMM|nr:DNA methyltransferase [Halomonas qiaohouensis]MDR5907512.1 N-6 DNA methylase [Halomonas qiaohouensis]